MRISLSLLLLTGCALLSACGSFGDSIKQENRTFFATDTEKPSELRFNVAQAGYIHSPYAPDAGWVNVRGIAPGTPVVCPYTGRVFVVPAYDTYPGNTPQ